jgi:hypothetical protein
MAENIKWKGDPLLYLRPLGSGLVVGSKHYQFDKDGNLERAEPLSQYVIDALISKDDRLSGMMRAANVGRARPDPEKPADAKAPKEDKKDEPVRKGRGKGRP